ncbi:TetR/AcrR family transcriptional regulator [Streptomyces sp. NRRL WC-3549]|uniref:TetR/AcrR family transcriptional regulator n=1 Tax=Streptomyces sp. NRRL WC-3549 TaxID=1463925 RepID=UPI0018FEE6E4|nr:TetR/AcrR family transcriptional regulator [Streptomyces sp. NRRL WC-3549]
MSKGVPHVPAALTAEQKANDRDVLLDTAESLIYAQGVQAVGMDRIREASGLSLKRIYSMFPTKEDIVVAVLRRRDLRWRADLAAYAGNFDDPTRRILAVFEWLRDWFSEPGFRGCAWVNIHGELGPSSPAVLDEVRAHKEAFREQIAGLLESDEAGTADAIYLLAEGAIAAAGISGNAETAGTARDAVERLLAGRQTSITP